MDVGFWRACLTGGLALTVSSGVGIHAAHRVLGQPAPESTGAISGVVVDGTDRAIGGAVVYLGVTGGGPAAQPNRQLTDSKGRFVFRHLPPSDQYFLNASKFGFLDGGYGRRRPGEIGSRIVLAEGEWFSSARIVLRRPAAITGNVVDERGDPVIGIPIRVLAQVPIGGRPQLAAGPGTLTDDRGTYRIAGLIPGRYLVTVPSVQVAMPAAPSNQESQALVPSDPRLEASSTAAIGLKGTERLALGQFATPPAPSARSWAYPIVFYPNALSVSEAAVIDLDYGQERSGISIQLQPVPTVSVSGRVTGPPEVASGLLLRLLPAGSEGLGVGSEAATAVVTGDESFTFVNVPSGLYTIIASRTTSEFAITTSVPTILPPSQTGPAGSLFAMAAASGPSGTFVSSRTAQGNSAWSGRTSVAVEDRDVAGVVVTMRQGVTLSGNFVYEGSTSAQAAVPRTVFAEPADGSAASGARSSLPQANSPWSFSIPGLLPGDYRLSVSGIGDVLVKSINWGGRDYTNTPFDASTGRDITGVIIRMTDKIPRLSGTLQDDGGRPAAGASAIAFPVEKEQWTGYGFSPYRIKSTLADSAGRYQFATLPAGDYYVIALDASERDAWQEPRFFETAQSRAERVSLDWGASATQDLRIVRLR